MYSEVFPRNSSSCSTSTATPLEEVAINSISTAACRSTATQFFDQLLLIFGLIAAAI